MFCLRWLSRENYNILYLVYEFLSKPNQYIFKNQKLMKIKIDNEMKMKMKRKNQRRTRNPTTIYKKTLCELVNF